MISRVLAIPTWRCFLGCSYCLAAKTRIKISKGGHHQIQNLKVGDKLKTLVEDNLVETEVTNVMSRIVYVILKIYFKSGAKIVTTEEHPFNVKGQWVEANKLKVGDEVVRPLSILRGKAGKISIKNQIKKHGFLPFTKLPASKLQKETFRKMLLENNPMKNPEIVKKSVANHKYRKSKLENWFSREIIKDLPVKYTGNGKFWVNRKNPDFKVIGQKKVIEISNWGYLDRGQKYIDSMNKHYSESGFKSKVFLFRYADINKVDEIRKELVGFIVNGDEIIKIEKNNVRRDRGQKVYNISCEPYHHFIAEGLLVHNCGYKLEEDGKSLCYRGSNKINHIERELTVDEWIKLLGSFKNYAFEFTGGEPLKYEGIEKIINSITTMWSITSNMVNFKKGLINLSRCGLWTASFHRHISEKAQEKFIENVMYLKNQHIRVAVTLVAEPHTLDNTFMWIDRFDKMGFKTNIHAYYDDPSFDWDNYPEEKAALKENKYLKYDEMLFKYIGLEGTKECCGGKDYITISPEGKMYRCMTDLLFGEKEISGKSESNYICKRTCFIPCDWAHGPLRRVEEK